MTGLKNFGTFNTELQALYQRHQHTGQSYSWIIHLGIWDMKSHLAGLKATFGALRILTERRSW